jgi:hypothetical protein
MAMVATNLQICLLNHSNTTLSLMKGLSVRRSNFPSGKSTSYRGLHSKLKTQLRVRPWTIVTVAFISVTSLEVATQRPNAMRMILFKILDLNIRLLIKKMTRMKMPNPTGVFKLIKIISKKMI